MPLNWLMCLTTHSVYWGLIPPPPPLYFTKEFWLSLTRICESCKCFRKCMVKLIVIFEKGKDRLPIITCTCFTSYMLVIRQSWILKKKILLWAKEVALICSVREVFLWFHNMHRKIPTLKSLFNKVAGLQHATLSNRDTGTYVFLWILKTF